VSTPLESGYETILFAGILGDSEPDTLEATGLFSYWPLDFLSVRISLLLGGL
jgi:hypothetical protein